MASFRCYDNSHVIATLIITNVHLYLIQLWLEFFQIFVYGDVVYAKTWELVTLKNCIEPPLYVKYWQIFWSWILRTVSKFSKRKTELLSCVPVLYKRRNLALCNAGKEMYTNAWCTCRAVGFSNLNLLRFCRSHWSRRRRCLSSITDGTSQWVVTCPGSSDRIRVLSVSIRLWVFPKMHEILSLIQDLIHHR